MPQPLNDEVAVAPDGDVGICAGFTQRTQLGAEIIGVILNRHRTALQCVKVFKKGGSNRFSAKITPVARHRNVGKVLGLHRAIVVNVVDRVERRVNQLVHNSLLSITVVRALSQAQITSGC